MWCWFPLATDSGSQSVDESFRFQAKTPLWRHQTRSCTRPSPCKIQRTHQSVCERQSIHHHPSSCHSTLQNWFCLLGWLCTLHYPWSWQRRALCNLGLKNENKKVSEINSLSYSTLELVKFEKGWSDWPPISCRFKSKRKYILLFVDFFFLFHQFFGKWKLILRNWSRFLSTIFMLLKSD